MDAFLTQDEIRLRRLAAALIDEKKAKIVIPANRSEKGFWFGGGNIIEFKNALYICGRYRNSGDSRTGLALGDRGSEFAIFRSTDKGNSFEKVAKIMKTELPGNVLSIEGTALRVTPDGRIQLFLSSEKGDLSYPKGFEDFQKQGTGVWTVDLIEAATPEELASSASTARTVFTGKDPNFIHYKDPFVYDSKHNNMHYLLFCTHPFNWTCSNTAFCEIGADGNFGDVTEYFFPKGQSWDVAMTRGTCIVDVPQIGAFANKQMTLFFYDGGECVRNLEEHEKAVKRNRGYSCEELGGLAYFENGHITDVKRISKFEPLFESPYGTGCSRYVQVCKTAEGMYATWQQSQADFSQPLVMHFLSWEAIQELLK